MTTGCVGITHLGRLCPSHQVMLQGTLFQQAFDSWTWILRTLLVKPWARPSDVCNIGVSLLVSRVLRGNFQRSFPIYLFVSLTSILIRDTSESFRHVLKVLYLWNSTAISGLASGHTICHCQVASLHCYVCIMPCFGEGCLAVVGSLKCRKSLTDQK